MWSSWFSNGLFAKKNNRNANLQKRIANLLDSLKTEEKNASPTLRELQNQKNKVKRMSSVYEENIAAFNDTNNTSILSRKSTTDRVPLSVKIDEILDHQPSMAVATDPADWKQAGKSLNYVLMEMDAEYIRRMEQLIEKYVDAFDNIPLLLKNESSVTNRQKEELFGPIKKIHELHKTEFHPILLACSGDVEFFARQVSEMCNNGSFNAYIIYAMDEKDCEHRRNVYYKFFMNEIMDKVGFAFEFRAIQQLARYHLIIIEMLNDLKDQGASDDAIKALTQTEIDWKRMMGKIYAMRNLASNH